jgi:hypothetical protein
MLLCCAGGLQHATAGTQQIAVRELLNQRYADEWVTYPFTAPARACEVSSLQLTGPRGPQAVQLSDVEYWPGTKFVKSAELSFVVDALEPLTTNDYTLTYGPAPGQFMVQTDLDGGEMAGSAILSTSNVEARFLLGAQTYAVPIPLKDLPGPLQSVRWGRGVWGGGSRWYGEAAVKSWSAQETEAGWIFEQVDYLLELADGGTARLTAQLGAGDTAIRWRVAVTGDHPDVGVDLSLGALPGVKQMVMPKGFGQWAQDRTVPLTPSDQPCCFLSPNSSLPNFFPEGPSNVHFAAAGGPEVELVSSDPAAWADPGPPFTYAGFKSWNMDMVPQMWERWQRKRLPVTYATDGTLSLRVNLAAGGRQWSTSAGMPRLGERLNVVKDYVLDWPEKAGTHPHLFASKAEEAEAWKRMQPSPQLVQSLLSHKGDLGWANEAYLYSGGSKEVAAQEDLVKQLGDELSLLGNFDTMRKAIVLAATYDAVIDTDLVTPQQRSLYRAQMAYLAYVMADPTCWSMERGYASGNPNMSASYTLSLGILACLLPDHPMAKTWAAYATGWMDHWLTYEVGPGGEFLPEGMHYGGGSVSDMVAYAVAAQRAGFHDFLIDPRLKRLCLYFAQEFTPPDPRLNNVRVSPPVGRGTAGDPGAIFGMLARATAPTDPAYSKVMQWMWAQSGYPMEANDWRLGGFEPFYANRALPAEKPAWGSALYPSLGVVLRTGVGTAAEDDVNLLAYDDSHRNLDVWAPGVGSLAQWYARGKPVSEAFYFATGYSERHELLRDGVFLARNWDGAGNTKSPFGYYTTTRPEAGALLPPADYVRATYTLTTSDERDWFPDKLPAWPHVTAATAATLDWTRQVLFLKDDDPAGANYLVFRDTTAGGQPTEWQFRSLSEKIGTPEQARDAAFLADKPGPTAVAARELPGGARYTALGQFDVDLEYFIASPADTPRYTMRYGGSRQCAQYEDLLNLRLPGDGSYFVAVFPRGRTEEAPTFSSLGEGKVIKVSGALGTDYTFLTNVPGQATAENASFQGTAGTVQARGSGLSLTLAAPGEVRYREYGLAAPFAVSLRVTQNALTLDLPADNPGGQVTLTAPTGWKAVRAAGVTVQTRPGTYRVTVPAGAGTVRLVRQ